MNHQTSRHFWPQDTSWLLCLKYLSPFFFVSVDEMSSADTYTLTCMKVNLLLLTLTRVFFSFSLCSITSPLLRTNGTPAFGLYGYRPVGIFPQIDQPIDGDYQRSSAHLCCLPSSPSLLPLPPLFCPHPLHHPARCPALYTQNDSGIH